MCAVSMVVDWGRTNWPDKSNDDYWMKKYLELVKRAEQYDKDNKEPDCVDPGKAPFIKEIMDRLDAIEKKLK